MIAIEGLVVRYGALEAVAGLDLAVPRGCLFGLLGPNGAGKTTTIACLAGLRAPDAGVVRVDGVAVGDDPAAVRRRVGLVPQHLALYPALTVRQNLSFFGQMHGIAGAALRDRVDFGLALAQLEARADARVSALSGGMARRLNLACGLLHDPPLLILDEPTTGVDAQSRNHIFETVRRLHAEGRTIIYTTHYMEEVEALCEQVAIMDRGRLLASDRLAGLLGGDGTGFTLEAAGPVDADRVQAALAAAGIDARVTPARQTLEQVFLGLTGRGLRDEDTP
ncbi:MAG: ABC transporter ATP-binding protein [Myxococcales bacterium]|nr:ABC transporter ATP-binding protein [Myxococcales bacterium]